VNVTPFVSWFPIIVAVAFGGRLLDRVRAVMLAGLCTVFWIALTVASSDASSWADPLNAAALLAGSAAIVAMGAWASEQAVAKALTAEVGAPRDVRVSPVASADAVRVRGQADAGVTPAALESAIEQFDDWLESHRDEADPWPAFDEFVRSTLYATCRATHVRTYRVLSEDDDLIPLTEPPAEAGTRSPVVSARHGIIGHVVTTGRSYMAFDPGHGALLDRMADAGSPAHSTMDWCFPISQGSRRIGVVVVGRVSGMGEQAPQPAHLRLVGQTIGMFWAMLCETCRSRSAETDDPVSKVLTREAFVRLGGQALRDSYRQGEPAAVSVVALERLRQLNDSGRWELADQLVREAAAIMRDKVRSDDLLGCFDESRFLILLRRVDSELAALIAGQLVSRLQHLCADESRWRTAIRVRCGVAGSGREQPDLRSLISSAVGQCHRARKADLTLSSDVDEGGAVGRAAAGVPSEQGAA
jgi:diguanylate cyclase (GGDEF)-like protein